MIIQGDQITIHGIINIDADNSHYLANPITAPIDKIIDVQAVNVAFTKRAKYFYYVYFVESPCFHPPAGYFRVTQNEYIQIGKALFPHRIFKYIASYDELPLKIPKFTNSILQLDIDDYSTKPIPNCQLVKINRI